MKSVWWDFRSSTMPFSRISGWTTCGGQTIEGLIHINQARSTSVSVSSTPLMCLNAAIYVACEKPRMFQLRQCPGLGRKFRHQINQSARIIVQALQLFTIHHKWSSVFGRWCVANLYNLFRHVFRCKNDVICYWLKKVNDNSCLILHRYLPLCLERNNILLHHSQLWKICVVKCMIPVELSRKLCAQSKLREKPQTQRLDGSTWLRVSPIGIEVALFCERSLSAKPACL